MSKLERDIIEKMKSKFEIDGFDYALNDPGNFIAMNHLPDSVIDIWKEYCKSRSALQYYFFEKD